ncbi:MAG: hypothetical protein H6807_16840 [Planctomycetes bacterium]|nr:hypothetical protein [Planctomycetota bacterium]
MKGFVNVIGLLTLAQWVFVGLLYGFIHYQEKDSPETLAKLHDMPVVGGYFPKVTLVTQAEKDREYGDELRARRLEAQRIFNLPKSWSVEEFEELSQKLAARGEELTKHERELEQRQAEIQQMMDEISRREDALVGEQDKLDKKAAEVLKDREALTAATSNMQGKIDAYESQAYKRIAKLLAGIDPKGAQERLMSAPEGETTKERNARFDEAAKILTFMDVEQAGQIINSMEPPDAALVLERMKGLAPGK